MVKMLESKAVKVVEEPEPKVDVKPEPGPEVIAESVSLQEEIFSHLMKIVELPIETIVDFQQRLLWS